MTDLKQELERLLDPVLKLDSKKLKELGMRLYAKEKMSDETLRRSAEFVQRNLAEQLKPSNAPKTIRAISEVVEKILEVGKRMTEERYHQKAEFRVWVTPRPDEPTAVQVIVVPLNDPGRSYLLWLNEMYPETFPLRKSRFAVQYVLVSHQGGKTVEKNGNTFVPGDKVTTTVGAFDRNGKTAAQRGTGEVRSEVTGDGRLKVAWQDGTESFEKPEDLSRG